MYEPHHEKFSELFAITKTKAHLHVYQICCYGAQRNIKLSSEAEQHGLV